MMTSKKYIPLPKDTKAFICANCRALSLNPTESCKVGFPKRNRDTVLEVKTGT